MVCALAYTLLQVEMAHGSRVEWGKGIQFVGICLRENKLHSNQDTPFTKMSFHASHFLRQSQMRKLIQKALSLKLHLFEICGKISIHKCINFKSLSTYSTF